MSKTVEITNGPSREELFDGLRLFAEKKITVNFLALTKADWHDYDSKLILSQQPTAFGLQTVIQGIQAEDGSGHSWNIALSVEVKTLLKLGLPANVTKVFSGKKAVTIHAHYSTKTRKGTISFDEPK